MADLDRAIAAAREALAYYEGLAECSADYDPCAHEITGKLSHLLAALDAARGEAAAWVDAESLESVKDRGHVGVVLSRDQRPGDAAVFAAPPAALAVPAYYPLGETIYTSPSEEVRFCYSRGQPNNINASRLGEACRRAAEKPGGDYIDGGLSLLKELEARGYGVFRFVKSGHKQAPPDAVPDPLSQEALLRRIAELQNAQGVPASLHGKQPTAAAVCGCGKPADYMANEGGLCCNKYGIRCKPAAQKGEGNE